MKVASYWQPFEKQHVKCLLCPHECRIAQGKTGLCRVRENKEGRLYSRNYAKVASIAVDPIEKKPLYHFYPGSYLLSVGTTGCNLRCGFCQNYGISQTSDVPKTEIAPADLVSRCSRAQEREPRVVGIAYTYNEPSVWYEYVFDASRFAHDARLKNVLVTNGYIAEEPLRELLPYVDALNIDLKAFSDEFYRRICHGTLEPVLRSVQMSVASGCHVEVTNLLVTSLNESEEHVRDLSSWIASVGRDVPLHLSRYFPNFELDLPPTSTATLTEARRIAREYLDYVYVGNVWGGMATDTVCPECGHTLLGRQALELSYCDLEANKCPNCGREIAMRGEVTWDKGE